MNPNTEEVYLTARTNTIKAAIQEGCTIVPTYFFGNTRLFNIAGASGSDSWLSKLSRRLRTSIIFFYGRWFAPIPFRHPLKMVTGEPIVTQQIDDPTKEQIDAVHQRVIKSLNDLYHSPKKPSWETRPLKIT